MSFLAQVWAIVRKDLAAEMHTREIVSAMLVFALLALLVFSFALDLQGESARIAAPGVVWASVAFAGTLGLSRSMAREQNNGCLDGMLLAPVDRSAIFFGKALGNLAFIGIVELALVPLSAILFDAPLLKPGVLLVLALGTIGYAGAGTLLAAIAVNTRAREVLLPVLLLPLVVPALIAAVKATAALMDGLSLGEVSGWLNLLIAYDLLMVAVSMVTFDYAVSE